VSGTLPVPLSLLETMPFMMVNGACIFQLGQGLSKPPVLTCHALVFVSSSSGRAAAAVGMATLAAYNNAALLEVDMLRMEA
jgi:hypothetical protein